MELRDYQVNAVQSLWTYFQHHKGNPVCALPTGTGKSIIIGEFIRGAFDQYPDQRILMLTHVKELIEQNAEKLLQLWPTAPVGIFSAGLGRKEVAPITYAGIASVWRTPEVFGHVDLIVIDECHLVSPKNSSMYGKFIDALKLRNPMLKVIGLSATPYRLGLGLLTEGESIFTDTAYDITSREEFNKLIKAGWLAPLVPKRTSRELDITGVRVVGGEYVQQDLQMAIDKEAITYYAMKELVEQAHDRVSWLVFTTGISHTDHVAEMLVNEFGIAAAPVHSKISAAERALALRQFKDGTLRCLVNNNVLTTGFDHPALDCIAVLRPTNSSVLWVQMLGRGTRPCEGKADCLVLDFAANTKRLGPINDPVIPKKKGKGRPGAAPVKVCEACNTYNHVSAVFCVECGFEFHKSLKHATTADERPLIAGDIEQPVVEPFKVDQVTYAVHRKQGRPDSLKVSYYCGLRMFQEWVCLEHSGFALHRAHSWWRERWPYPLNKDPEQRYPPTALDAAHFASHLKTPTTIHVWVNRKHPEIKRYDYA